MEATYDSEKYTRSILENLLKFDQSTLILELFTTLKMQFSFSNGK